MMTVQITCSECGSGIHIYPSQQAQKAICDICSHETHVHFCQDHEKGELHECPVCARKDFYRQKDFNRKIGVAIFIIAAILSIWTYGVSFIVAYAIDFLLFKKLGEVAICYKCQTIFRNVKNLADIHPYNHEMSDRIVYSDHDFGGRPLEH